MDIVIENIITEIVSDELKKKSTDKKLNKSKSIFADSSNKDLNTSAEKALMKQLTDNLELLPNKQGKYSEFNVAIIDNFDFGNLANLNIPHGLLVQKYITENLPGVKIEQKKVLLNSDNTEKMLIDHLQNIIKEIEKGKKYDAINMSMQTHDFVWIDSLKIKSNGEEIQITNKNINQFRDKLKELHRKNFVSLAETIGLHVLQMNKEEVENDINKYIESLEKITETMKKISDKGVKIFIANNNECAEKICYSDLIDLDSDYENCNNPNIITVSANDCSERTSSLSDIKEKSIYKLKFLDGGIDITDDGIIDIKDKTGTGKMLKNAFGINKFEGNSLAVPVVLANYLKEEYNKKHK